MVDSLVDWITEWLIETDIVNGQSKVPAFQFVVYMKYCVPLAMQVLANQS